MPRRLLLVTLALLLLASTALDAPAQAVDMATFNQRRAELRARYVAATSVAEKQAVLVELRALELEIAAVDDSTSAPVRERWQPTEADLAGRPFVEKKTFEGAPSPGWNRDNVEIETAVTVTGADARSLAEAMRDERTSRRVSKNRVVEAFTYGYDINEMPWDSDAHETRERSPFVSLTIESGRFELEPEDGRRELSLGTDIMDDIYYDTPDFLLHENGMSLRGRVRWDTATEVRRLLVAAKFGSQVDEFGLKRADKLDSRTEGGTHRGTLDEDVRRGMAKWSFNGRDEVLPAVKAIHERLSEAGVLPDVAGHEDVLALEPKANLRSTRRRFHLNETRIDDVLDFFEDAGTKRLEAARDRIEEARDKGWVSAGDEADVARLEGLVGGILDRTLVAERAAARLKEIDPNLDVTPDSIGLLWPGSLGRNGRIESVEELEKRRVVAEAIDELLHEAGDALGDVRRVLTNSGDQTLEDHADLVRDWIKSENQALVGHQTFDAFLAEYDRINALDPAEKKARIDAFNAFGEAQKAAGNDDFEDFEPVDEATWDAIGPQLENEVLRVAARQLESAGTTARTLWFNEAREFYVPGSTRSTGNLLIDTFDYTEIYRHEDWLAIPEDQRKPGDQLPLDKMLDAVVVNEVQIELGHEKPYLERMAELRGLIAEDRTSMVMKWATDSDLLTSTGRRSYEDAVRDLQGKPDSELLPVVDEINEFLVANDSALDPITVDDLRAIDAGKLTPSIRNRPVRTERTHERNLDGARFVFDEYQKTLHLMTEIKRENVLRRLRDAGRIDWEPAESSKGDRAISILAGEAATDPGAGSNGSGGGGGN